MGDGGRGLNAKGKGKGRKEKKKYLGEVVLLVVVTPDLMPGNAAAEARS